MKLLETLKVRSQKNIIIILPVNFERQLKMNYSRPVFLRSALVATNVLLKPKVKSQLHKGT